MTNPGPFRSSDLAASCIRMERAVGRAEVALDARGRPLRLFQAGSAKAILLPGPEVTFLNTSGGLAGGDRLSLSLTVAPGLRATATTQSAERAYRSSGAEAKVDLRLEVGEGGFLDWLPQETILFDRSCLSRRTTVTLARGAGCLVAETVVLGRAAMGETVSDLAFRDWREVRRDGRSLWLEPLSLTGGALDSPATLAGARVFSSVALICDGAEGLLGPLRRVLDQPGCRAAASALPGRLMLRLMAADALQQRRQLIRALAVMRDGRPLPRVWQN